MRRLEELTHARSPTVEQTERGLEGGYIKGVERAGGVPIASALIGPLTPSGEGVAGAVVHADASRSFHPRVLVIAVARNGDGDDLVDAFVTNGRSPSGTVRLATDRYGKTWLLEPPVSEPIQAKG